MRGIERANEALLKKMVKIVNVSYLIILYLLTHISLQRKNQYMFDKKNEPKKAMTCEPDGNMQQAMLLHGGDEVAHLETEPPEQIDAQMLQQQIEEDESEEFRNDKSTLMIKNLQPKKSRFDAPLR